MFKKVLVPLDDSDVAPGILPYVSYLAKSLNIPVELMSNLDQDNLAALEKNCQRRLWRTPDRADSGKLRQSRRPGSYF